MDSACCLLIANDGDIATAREAVNEPTGCLGCVGELARPARLAREKQDRAGRLPPQPCSLSRAAAEREGRRDCGACPCRWFGAGAQTAWARARRRRRRVGPPVSARPGAGSRTRCTLPRHARNARDHRSAPRAWRDSTVRVRPRTPPGRSRKAARSSEAPTRLVPRANAPVARLEPPLNDWNRRNATWSRCGRPGKLQPITAHVEDAHRDRSDATDSLRYVLASPCDEFYDERRRSESNRRIADLQSRPSKAEFAHQSPTTQSLANAIHRESALLANVA